MNKRLTVRCLLPDEQTCEFQTEDVASFLQLLEAVDYLSIDGIRYRVMEIELVMDVTSWLMVTLEEGHRKVTTNQQLQERTASYLFSLASGSVINQGLWHMCKDALSGESTLYCSAAFR